MFIIKGEITKQQLIDELMKSIEGEELGAFIGAGLSIPAGYSDWKKLLKEPAEKIGLDVEKESDLVNLAQYYSNSRNRSAVDNLIRESFSKKAIPTTNHKLLAKLPITTYWTTNYDKLIEKSLEDNMKLPFMKTKDEHLRALNSNFDVIVYKLHGDIDSPEDAVITRSDYEEFGYKKRKLFRDVLEGDLLTKTFLFLGFSFSDPNFNYVIGKLRVLLDDNNTRNHYCIIKKVSPLSDNYEYEKVKQELQIEDLNRYGILTCLVDEYDEITDILKEVVNRFCRKTIFISGSAENYQSFSIDKGREFIHKLAYKLIENGYQIVNGYGKGIGEFVLNGVSEYCLANDLKIKDNLTLIPFPQQSSSDINLEELYEKNRNQMIENCGIALFLFGNKKDNEIAKGVLKEFEIANSHGLVCLPLGYTGGASKYIFDNNKPSKQEEDICIAFNDINVYQEGKLDDTIDYIIKIINNLNNGGR